MMNDKDKNRKEQTEYASVQDKCKKRRDRGI